MNNNITITLPVEQKITIPNGYKKTTIGIIPVDWDVKKLKDIVTQSKLGGNYENSDTNKGIPVIKMGNIGRGYIQLEKIQFLPELEPYNEEDILKEGDLLFNTRNTLDLVGKVAIWRNEIPLALYNSNLLRMTFKESSVFSNWYMNYLFNSNKTISQLKGIATGTTSVAAIYGRDLNFVKFALPPLQEQQKIAEILSTWDEAITNCKIIINSLKARNKGLAQQLLTGKKRLSGFSEKWGETTIEKITKYFSKKNKKLIGARIYSVTNSNGFVFQSDHFSREVAGNDLTGYKIISKDEFAYNPARINVGSIAFFEDEIGIISSLYVCFKTNHLVMNGFFIEWLKMDKTRHDIERYGEGGVRIYLWYDLFKKLKINLPTIEEQIAITQVLETANQELKSYEDKLKVLRLQKKGLMQQLLTGKLRVNVN